MGFFLSEPKYNTPRRKHTTHRSYWATDCASRSRNLVYGTMCTLLSTKSIARGWEPVRDATVTKPNPLTSRLWGSHAAAKNPHPTGTYLIRLPFMGPPMVTHAGRGHNICQELTKVSVRCSLRLYMSFEGPFLEVYETVPQYSMLEHPVTSILSQ